MKSIHCKIKGLAPYFFSKPTKDKTPKTEAQEIQVAKNRVYCNEHLFIPNRQIKGSMLGAISQILSLPLPIFVFALRHSNFQIFYSIVKDAIYCNSSGSSSVLFHHPFSIPKLDLFELSRSGFDLPVSPGYCLRCKGG